MRPYNPRIDVSDHLASRRAATEVLESQQVVIAKKFHDDGRIDYSVLIRDEYYDVNEREFALLQEGCTPADLELYPVDKPLNRGAFERPCKLSPRGMLSAETLEK
jgi:hypothetical protein